MPTVADFVRARENDDNIALHAHGECWTYREFVALCAQRAAYLLAHRRPGPFHVGILLENRAEFPMWLGACALAGAVSVGLNSTHRGPDLARDITHTDCQFIITEAIYREECHGLDLTLSPANVLDVDTAAYQRALAAFNGAPLPDVEVKPGDTCMLIFTSGSSGAPKACICSHGRIASLAGLVAQHCGHARDTVSYVTMPWFHAAAVNMGWLPALRSGSATVIRKFSVSHFLADVRRYGVTHFNYVGKPLAYLLTAPEHADDAVNSLRMVLGNEGAADDIERFAKRFGCVVVDGYGSTEGGVSISRTPAMPRGCLGMAHRDSVQVLNPATGKECPRATFGPQGELSNANEAIGELANLDGATGFEGYWRNPDAASKRVRDGIFWTGDLAYRDAEGHFWFAGRDDDWLRVDGENIASAQIEQILFRHPDVLLAGVYAVPDPQVGDRIMAALQLRSGAAFDARAFSAFLAGQPDFSRKWMPGFIRLCAEIPMTATAKVLRRQLRQERWRTADPIWWRDRKDAAFRQFTENDIVAYETACSLNPAHRL